jgi:2-hydroxychromene-2-carboxylate isomerase
MPIRWPDPWPANYLTAMRAATFCQQIGRAVAFSLAAFRQAFAAGRDLSDPDSVVIAAAACEMHPAAVLKAAETRGVADALARATADAGATGVRSVPAVRVGDRVFHGDAELEAAAAALRGTRAA